MLVLLAGLLLALTPVSLMAADEDAKITAPLARINSEGMVKAYPDVALMNFTILTEAPKAPSASAENAKKADAFLKAVTKFLHAGDTVKSTGYRIMPLYTYGNKGQKPVISGFRASSGFQVRLKDTARLGDLIDLGVQHGANEIQGPMWEHSKLETLTQEAAVLALQQARQMAEVLGRSQGLKVKRLLKVSTSFRVAPFPRDDARMMRAPVAAEAPATPIEVGEQEIRAQIEALFELE